VTTDKADTPPDARTIEARRWKIGIAISLFFGIFGAVMAFLNYSAGSKPAPPPTVSPTAAPPPAAAPAEPAGNGHGKGRGPR
jgi:hypothetical protein